MTLVILGHLEFHPDDAEVAAAAAAELAVTTQSDRGRLHYSYARDVRSPEILRIAEWWEDEQCLREHLAQQHVLVFEALIATLRVSKIDGTKYVVSDNGPVDG